LPNGLAIGAGAGVESKMFQYSTM